MGKERAIALFAIQCRHKQNGDLAHVALTPYLGKLADSGFGRRGRTVPRAVLNHVSSCTMCQDDIARVRSALEAEEGARIEYLLEDARNTPAPER